MADSSEDDIWGDIVTPEWMNRHGVVFDPKTGSLQGNAVADISVNSRGKISQAQVKNCSLLTMLAERRLIDQFHVDYALAYLELKRRFCRKTAHRSTSFRSPDGVRMEDESTADTVYILVSRQLRPRLEPYILECLYNPVDVLDMALLQAPPVQGRPLDVYIHALNELPRIMRNASDEVNSRLAKENACANTGSRIPCRY